MYRKNYLSEDELFYYFLHSAINLYGERATRRYNKIMRNKYQFYISKHRELVKQFKSIYKEILHCISEFNKYNESSPIWDKKRIDLIKEWRRLFDEERQKAV